MVKKSSGIKLAKKIKVHIFNDFRIEWLLIKRMTHYLKTGDSS